MAARAHLQVCLPFLSLFRSRKVILGHALAHQPAFRKQGITRSKVPSTTPLSGLSTTY
jgi:hypothetical protein